MALPMADWTPLPGTREPELPDVRRPLSVPRSHAVPVAGLFRVEGPGFQVLRLRPGLAVEPAGRITTPGQTAAARLAVRSPRHGAGIAHSPGPIDDGRRMPRFKLTIEYAGTKYSGWQIQKNARTVQGEIDAAVREATGRKDFELYGSGRTDAGVHALAQVAQDAELRALMREAVQLEKEFIRDCLPVNAVGLAIDEFLTYIDYIADRRLEGCGLAPLSAGIKNPLPWLAEMMDIKKEQNFFEGRVTEYQKS